MSHFLRFSLALALVLALPFTSEAATKKKKAAAAPAPASASARPADHDYTGAIVIDAADGKVLFEDNADVTAYPASVTKLMNPFCASSRSRPARRTSPTGSRPRPRRRRWVARRCG
jgi:D-alanyl-D-alanine carboxypeptidase